MTQAAPRCVVFKGENLLPEPWAAFAADGPVRTFNPGLLRDAPGWIFAYRIVGADGKRRIGLCRLNEGLDVVAGSAVALSDRVRFRPDADYPELGTQWFADPRLYRFGRRLFIYWNSGWHEPRNCQFIQELDPVTLSPIPGTTARELQLHGERQKLEKNWTLFEALGRFYAVYSVTPHRILEFSLAGEGDILFSEAARVDWSIEGYPASHGGLRGGAPPCLFAGVHWSFCHSVHDGADGYRYLPAVYCFHPHTPFSPTARPVRPLQLGNPFGGTRTYARLNPAVGEVVYPCGAVHDGARWLVSHGINDEYCAISQLDHADVQAAVERLSGGRE